MRMDRRAALLGGAAALWAPGVARGQAADEPFEGGIGGTGIVGTLTALGSVRVNGLRVAFAPGLRVATAFGAVAPSALGAGMTLSVLATGRGAGLRTRAIGIDWPLVGTLRAAGGALTVNGARVVPEPGMIGRAAPGARVAVSGLWSGGAVIASRMEPAPASADLVSGTVSGGRVGGVAVRGGRLPEGRFATVLGRGRADGIDAAEVRTGRAVFADGLRRLAVEGYLSRIDAAPGFRLDGLGHRFAPDVALAPLVGRRAVYVGAYDGRFRARAGHVLPEGVASRRAALSGGLGAAFGGPVVRTLPG